MNELIDKYIKNENNLFQSKIWESFQQKLENDTFWISGNEEDILVIKMPLIKNFTYLYCPRAPQTTEEGWRLFLNRLKEIAKNEKALFVRVEPMIVPNGILKELQFKKVKTFSPLSNQFSPMNSLLLDLTQSEEEVLNQMKPKCRYNIRLAEKKGIKIRESIAENDLKAFYKLSQNMENRGYFSHPYDHYLQLFNTLIQNKAGKLFIAEYEKEILSAILVSNYNQVAIYLHGASSDNKRELMPNYLIQWHAIKDAKKNKCEIYDFWGIAPENSNTNHGWSGITRFKNNFGGEKIQFLGAYDYTFSNFWYIILCSVNFVRKVLKR